MQHPKKLFPVIHVLNEQQAVDNAAIAFQAGCDGVFLVNHENQAGERDLSFTGLLRIHSAVAATFPNKLIGVNCLDLPAVEVFQHLTPQVSAVWVDNAEIDERQGAQPAAILINAARVKSGWDGLYFGGVAFKYQRPVSTSAVGRAATIAKTYMDVVTTSGVATGEVAQIDKIKAMKKAIHPKPLAIASGITAENAYQFLPWVDYFLVATGISRSFYELDPEKVSALATLIHQYKPDSEMNV